MNDVSSPTSERLVLIVEDDPDVRETLQLIVEDEGVRAVGVSNGREAVEYLLSDRARPDLILLDLMMPIMSGVEFLSWRREQPSPIGDVPVVVVSASNARNAERAVAEFDLRGFLQKPLTLEALTSTLSPLM
jgi:CheY-like chemotaxis protein